MKWLNKLTEWFNPSRDLSAPPILDPDSRTAGSSSPWFKQAALWLKERDNPKMGVHVSEIAYYEESELAEMAVMHPDNGIVSLWSSDERITPELKQDEFAERRAHVEKLLKRLEL